MSVAVQSRISFRLMGRSYLAFVLAPELPFVDWLVELDRRVENSLSFFANRPLVLDLTGVAPTRAETSEIIAFIEERHLRLIAVEGFRGTGCPNVWHRSRARSRRQACSSRRKQKSQPVSRRRSPGSPSLPWVRPAPPCWSTNRSAPASRSSIPMAMSSSSARWPRARKSSPAVPSTSTAPARPRLCRHQRQHQRAHLLQQV